MKSQKILSLVIMMVMFSTMLAFGQARDPKTGRFISKKAASTSSFNKMHPRDPKTGRFIKKSALVTPVKHGMMSSHPMSHGMMPSHPMGHGMMSSHTMSPVKHGSFMSSHSAPHVGSKMVISHKMTPVKKPGMMSKIKTMFSKKKKG